MATKYTVNGVIEGSAISPTGNLRKKYTYNFTTAKGITATVDVPEEGITAEKVAATIQAKADLLDSTIT